MFARKISTTQKQQIVERYIDGESFAKISKDYPISASTTRRVLLEYNIPLRKRTYEADFRFFENMSPALAYIIGYALADGCLSLERNSLIFVSIDNDLLQQVASYFNRPVNIHKKSFNPNHNTSYHLQIYEKKIVRRFYELGIHPNKTHDGPCPQIEDKFIWHFIRGIFDGDGSICWNNKELAISIANNPTVIQRLSCIFNDHNIKHHIQHRGRCYIIRATDSYARIFLHKIYQYSHHIRLKRKYIKYRNYLRSRRIYCTLCKKRMVRHKTSYLCPECKHISSRVLQRWYKKRNKGIDTSLLALIYPEETHLDWTLYEKRLQQKRQKIK
jgi:hypothetical protein